MATTRHACLAVVLMLVAAPAMAQGAAARPDVDLMSITALKCSFSVSAVGTWKGGEPAGQIRTGGTVAVELIDVDASDGSARLAGAGAAEDIVLQASAWNLHFLEVARSGRLTMTTVFGQETKEGRLKAVHTRTDYLKISMPGFESEPTAAQYYGECAPTRGK
jgi:hypothetical protein